MNKRILLTSVLSIYHIVIAFFSCKALVTDTIIFSTNGMNDVTVNCLSDCSRGWFSTLMLLIYSIMLATSCLYCCSYDKIKIDSGYYFIIGSGLLYFNLIFLTFGINTRYYDVERYITCECVRLFPDCWNIANHAYHYSVIFILCMGVFICVTVIQIFQKEHQL